MGGRIRRRWLSGLVALAGVVGTLTGSAVAHGADPESERPVPPDTAILELDLPPGAEATINGVRRGATRDHVPPLAAGRQRHV